MQTIKEKIIELVKKLPDNTNYDDIMENYYK